MASNLRKMIWRPLVTVLVLVVAIQAQGWAVEHLDAAAADETLVPVKPAKPVMVGITGGGGVGTLAAPICLQCKCCYKSNPAVCPQNATACCSTFNCDPAGKCSLVQRCGRGGC